MNQVILVGRLVKDIELRSTINGTNVAYLTLAVDRPYKNSEGKYETDFIRCILWKEIASNTHEYCHKGDCIGIKGRVEVRKYKDKNENTKWIQEIVAEKVTFLSKAKTEKPTTTEEDPFKDFGEEVIITDDDLPFE